MLQRVVCLFMKYAPLCLCVADFEIPMKKNCFQGRLVLFIDSSVPSNQICTIPHGKRYPLHPASRRLDQVRSPDHASDPA